MQIYLLGVVLAVLAGITNFTGQILQKKAINDVSPENRGQLMKYLVKSPVWVTGLFLVIVVNVILIALAQSFIGAALIPGLTASGFIVLGIGSVKILGEKLRREEVLAICLLVLAIILISFSQLSIEGDLLRFKDDFFVKRIVAVSLIFLALWLGLFYRGKKRENAKALPMALGAGFPFIISNIWVQPLLISMGAIFANNFDSGVPVILVFTVATIIVIFSNLFGIIHFQHAMAESNASIVIPIQQIPQQLSPIVIYFFIYQLTVPGTSSYIYLFSGIVLVIFAGFILSRRQSELEAVTKVD